MARKRRALGGVDRRFLSNDIAALQAAGEPISPRSDAGFLMTAPTEPKQMESEGFLRSYHAQVMDRAFRTPKSPIHSRDFAVLCKDFWCFEYPSMDPKTRHNGMAGVMNILHPFNSGLVREMIAGESNVTPDAILKGRWV